MNGSRPGAASLGVRSAPGLASRAWCEDEQLYVELTDGRVVTHDLPDFVSAVPLTKRGGCEVEAHGTAIWWPALEEGVGLNWVFGVRESVIEDLAGFTVPPETDDAG
jgi:hypothetical protein